MDADSQGVSAQDTVRTRARHSVRQVPSHATHPAQKHDVARNRIIVVVAVVVAVALLGVGGFFVFHHFFNPYEGASVADGTEVTVVIPEGSDGNSIIQILLDAGVIHSKKDFLKAVNEQGADQSLRCGSYTFLTGSDPEEVVKQLVSGSNADGQQLQVPEGLTVKQTAALVESSLGISASDFLDQAKASNYVSDYPFLEEAANDSLEGFLYPKTYDLSGKEVTADTVIRLMLSQYDEEVRTLDFAACKQLISERYGLNVIEYDVLTLASIIEKEAINESDRPLVSSVFYNRLKQGMMLQSDATMSYAVDGAVTADDLKKDDPYNTYYYKGLPPTPICNPSLWAIEAAMNPADTNYTFFFIIEDGTYSNHTFTETYEEHEAAYATALEEQAAAKEANASSDGTEGD